MRPGSKIVETEPPGIKETPYYAKADDRLIIKNQGINSFGRPRRQSEFEEILGELHSIKLTDIGLIAVIGKISVLLPEELAEQLHGLIGRRVAVLKLGGYHVRCLDGEKHV